MNTSNVNTKKSYNPKSHSPAVYIPCWLIQVPSSQLSHQAKLLFGRLAQWSTATGTVYRSVNQLSEEIGVSSDCIERTLKELRDVKLIETYQVKAGGVNHYRFLEHEWMSEPINKNLEYSHINTDLSNGLYPPDKNVGTSPQKCGYPPRRSAGTPPAEVRVHKIKEIKRNNNNNNNNNFSSKKSELLKPIISEKIDNELLRDRKIYLQSDDLERTEEEFLTQCSHFLDNANKDKYLLSARLKALKTIIKKGFFEKPSGYTKNKIIKSLYSPEEQTVVLTYKHAKKMEKLGCRFEDFMPDEDEVEKALELLKREAK